MTVQTWGRDRLGPAASVLAALTLSACAHYTPAPPHPERFAATFDARRLDEQPEGHLWTGAELLTAALARNPAVADAAAKAQTAAAAVRTSKVPPAFGLTLTAEYARESPHWGHSASADIPLDVGGRRSSRISTAELQALQARYDLQEAIWTVRNALAKARADLAGADTEAALADQAAGLRVERVKRLERRVAAGEDDRLALLTSRTDLIAAERRARDAHARREQARAALAAALGVPALAVADLKLAPPAEAPPPGALAAWRSEALLSRRDVLRAVADYDIAENALKLEVAKQYPDLRLAPGYNWDHGVLKLPVGLGLGLPPMDMNRAAIAQAEAARIAAGRSLETTQAKVYADVDQAAAAQSAAQESLARIQADDLPTAQRVQAAAERQLRAGETDRVDELAARAATADAEVSRMDAERASRAATADLEYALRRSFDPAEAAVLQSRMESP